jgi:5-methylcytosine-specific restriction endonuclease McrA
MAMLALVHEAGVVNALYDTVHTAAQELRTTRRATARAQDPDTQVSSDPDLGADARRADTLAALLLGTPQPDGSVRWDRAATTQVVLNLVIDYDTLRGLAEHPVLLGDEPVPAAIGREAARFATSVRRLVTDPVDGHLLDYGARQYLPAPLRDYVLARDGGCRSPGCTRRAPRHLQLDHVVPFPTGPSSTANTGALCVDCHQRKTAGLLTITHSTTDGAATFTTAWGQAIHIPPRPYLHDPRNDEHDAA